MWPTLVQRNRLWQQQSSRVISAQKANTPIAFSLDVSSSSGGSRQPNGLARSTANLYSAVQPGGSLYGLQASNPWKQQWRMTDRAPIRTFDGRVTTRANSPSNLEIDEATRDSLAGTLSFTVSLLNQSFSVANTVVNGIHPLPDEFTGGEGPATGQEVMINVAFTTPVVLGPDHYFFRPEALVENGDFLWLSVPRPLFEGDLQTWIRNDDLAPDWLRVGTDITGQGPFNAAFSLSGTTVPEPGCCWSGA